MDPLPLAPSPLNGDAPSINERLAAHTRSSSGPEPIAQTSSSGSRPEPFAHTKSSASRPERFHEDRPGRSHEHRSRRSHEDRPGRSHEDRPRWSREDRHELKRVSKELSHLLRRDEDGLLGLTSDDPWASITDAKRCLPRELAHVDESFIGRVAEESKDDMGRLRFLMMEERGVRMIRAQRVRLDDRPRQSHFPREEARSTPGVAGSSIADLGNGQYSVNCVINVPVSSSNGARIPPPPEPRCQPPPPPPPPGPPAAGPVEVAPLAPDAHFLFFVDA